MIQLRWKTYLFYLLLATSPSAYSSEDINTVTAIVDDAFEGFSEPATMVFTPTGTNPSGSFAYIVNYNDLTVNIVDTATNTVVAIVDDSFSSFDFPNGIAITPDGLTLYVSNDYYDEVCIIDALTYVMYARVNDEAEGLFDYPTAIAITPDGSTLYVLNGSGDCQVVIVDVATNTVTGVVSGTSLTDPVAIAITPDGTTAYVTDSSNNTVSIIDIATNICTGVVDDTLGAFNFPAGLAISPDGTLLYVANYNGGEGSFGTVSIIDITTASVIGLVDDPGSTFLHPYGIVIHPSGSTVYVANEGDGEFLGSVSIIDVATQTVTGVIDDTLYAFNQPVMLGISPAGTPLYVSNQGSNQVSVVSTPEYIAILPPTNLVGRSMQNSFLSQINLINAIGFDAPESGTVPVAYKIYKNSSLSAAACIGIVSVPTVLPLESTFVFLDGHKQYSTTYTYYVTSVDAEGNESEPVSISITTIANPRNL
ncbi:YncE family protein [Candidatus Babeliales bacterium]|nr:YncE family protein [Candidatus Babeliales bacterium]MBP9844374.1 YncE family protein [Candidatus Babeliales bacterium]